MKSSNASVRLTFHGAAETVTGSRYLVEYLDHRILVDCGLFQGKKALRLRNWEDPPFDPKSLSAIILTHAHIDHTGYLPLVVRRGYRGPIYCNAATATLLGLLLPDSAKLQEEEAKYANIHGTSKHHPAKPLYDESDVAATLTLLKQFGPAEFEMFPGVRVSTSCAGHILGSVSLSLECGSKRITFSGDVGRYDSPLLPDPQPHALGDVLVCESTYGNRTHGEANTSEQLADVIRSAIPRKGPIIIPAFALGRTQTLLYLIGELERAGTIPALPVYVDSPMAVDATKIYHTFRNDFDDDAVALVRLGKTPLMTAKTKFCKAVEDSKQLNHLQGTRIIIAASGMVTGGRVLHHMRNWLPYERTTVVFVGYQGEGTRGAHIQAREKTVRIFGQDVPIRAEVRTISGLSAHGDRDELTRWLKSCSGSPKIVRITHGEVPAATAFAEHLEKNLHWDARIARMGECLEI